jgi:hypothetical protein
MPSWSRVVHRRKSCLLVVSGAAESARLKKKITDTMSRHVFLWWCTLLKKGNPVEYITREKAWWGVQEYKKTITDTMSRHVFLRWCTLPRCLSRVE